MLVDENNFLVGWWTWKNCHKHIWCFVSKISETKQIMKTKLWNVSQYEN